jgi:uncharacterized protein YqeY
MTESDLKLQIGETTKAAMKARDKDRVAALRLVNSEIKRVEVDERRELTNEDVLAILNRMLKQRHDSLSQFEAAGREDLAEKERYEIGVIREFMPEPLSADALAALVDEAVASTGATEMKDMGKVMGVLKPKVQGRADMGALSGLVKARLAG